MAFHVTVFVTVHSVHSNTLRDATPVSQTLGNMVCEQQSVFFIHRLSAVLTPAFRISSFPSLSHKVALKSSVEGFANDASEL